MYQLADRLLDTVHTQPPLNIPMIEPIRVHRRSTKLYGYEDVGLIAV